jgi:hypothetical protein
MMIRLRTTAALSLLLACSSITNAQDGWEPLFDGQTLKGWRAAENPSSFRVVDGSIAADGLRAHLFYVGDGPKAEFKNFEFSAEVMTRPGANSGIYFHTELQDEGFPAKGFEAQIDNSAGPLAGYLELKKTGSLYGIRNQYKATVGDNQWFTMFIAVRGKRIEIRVNDVLLVDYLEPAEPVVPSDRKARRISGGTFGLQCHDPGSKVFFRNLRVRRLPDEMSGPETRADVDDIYRQIIELGSANFPLIDFHVHLKGGLTLEEALALSRRLGINYGIAVNCGLGFPIGDDSGMTGFLESMRGQPVFVGMQAEGREWVRLFSPEAVARFDYVFTDAMTFTNKNGRRMRLWIPDEVEVGDKQEFMDMLAERIVGIMDNEPIDIYVNPTVLPESIAAEYDSLWTPKRMKKVIDAAVRNGVAIEINNRYRLPSAAFIRKAKQAGVKFTIGTNNAGSDLGRIEYALQIVRECGLTWQNMWMPKPDSQKPIQTRGFKNN